MNLVLFENSAFWPQYFLEILGSIFFFFMAMIYLIYRKENRMNLFISIFSFVFLFFFLYNTVIPKTTDMNKMLKGQIETKSGNLLSIGKVKEENKYHYNFEVDNKTFKIESSDPNLSDFVGQEIVVFYLKETNIVMRIEILERSKY